MSKVSMKKQGMMARVSRVSAPVWATALGLAAMGAVAGQALGPVLAGSASGNVGVVASQNLFFSSAVATKGYNGDINQAVAAVDTSGLILQAAFRMHRGDAPSLLDVGVENRGDNTRSALVKVYRPVGTSVNLDSSDCGIAQSALSINGGMQMDTYLLTVPATDCTINGQIKVGTAEPLGSYGFNIVLEEIP